nr:disease resistance protein RPP2B-like [Populus alba]
MSDSSCLYPLDRDELEVRLQAKRARFQADRWEDYYVMRRTYEFLADLQVPARASSFCLRGSVTPEWFSHQNWGSTVTCQLSSHWANSEFLGFVLCAVIAFHYFNYNYSLRVKCTYHFRNEHSDSHDLYCYLHGWNDDMRICSEHIFVRIDPCLVVKENDMF